MIREVLYDDKGAPCLGPGRSLTREHWLTERLRSHHHVLYNRESEGKPCRLGALQEPYRKPLLVPHGALCEHWVTRIPAQLGQGGLAQLTVPVVGLCRDSENRVCKVLWERYSIDNIYEYVHKSQCPTDSKNFCLKVASLHLTIHKDIKYIIYKIVSYKKIKILR